MNIKTSLFGLLKEGATLQLNGQPVARYIQDGQSLLEVKLLKGGPVYYPFTVDDLLAALELETMPSAFGFVSQGGGYCIRTLPSNGMKKTGQCLK